MDNKKPVIGVLGSGSWATALIKILTSNENRVNWWVRKKEDVDHIISYKHNPSYLSAVEIHLNKVTPVANMEEVIKQSDWLILVIPAAFVKDALEGLNPELFEGKKIISAIKGMIPDENLLISDFMEKHYGTPPADTAVIAGPCHAE